MSYNASTGKIYCQTGLDPKIGVSIRDIQQALGTTESDLGKLCMHKNVNPWAKFKPVKYATGNLTTSDPVKDTTDQWSYATSRWKNTSDWWRGLSDAVCGIIPKSFPSLSSAYIQDFINSYDGVMNGWKYDRPLGGGAEWAQAQQQLGYSLRKYWFRKTDFAGYNAKAPAPIEGFTIRDRISYTGTLSASAIMNFSGNYDCVTLDDISSELNGAYFGILLVDQTNNSPVLIATASMTGSSSVFRRFGEGTFLPYYRKYDVYPLLCDASMFTQSFINTQHKFWTCPMCSKKEIYLVTKDDLVDVTIEQQPFATETGKIAFKVINGNESNITNLHYKINQISNDESDSGWHNWNDANTDVTVGANSASDPMVKSNLASNSFIHIYFYYNNGISNSQYYRHMTVIEPRLPGQE